mgnify:CR=1 FL=1
MTDHADPLRAAAQLLSEIAGTIADLENEKAAITAKIETALDVAVAHGFDRATVRSTALSLRLGFPPRDERGPLRSLYLAAIKSVRE